MKMKSSKIPKKNYAKKNYDLLEKTVGHGFSNPHYLTWALSHPSAKPKNKQFERLEFLGDRVLGLCMATLLLEVFTTENEGSLAKRQAVLVSKESCQTIANLIRLDDFLDSICDDGAHVNRISILADGVEALLGAIYLDAGLAPCLQFVREFWTPLLHESKEPPKDAKSSLQEWLQKRGKSLPIYTLMENTGPAHQPHIVCEVVMDGYPSFQGIGGSRRQAEQEAAQTALAYLKKIK
jgi:ribonuclease-3